MTSVDVDKLIEGEIVLEQEKANQEEGATTSDANIAQDGLTEYRVYEHPILPKRIVKLGFCWPALIVGPAYLIYRRLWMPLVVWVVVIVLIRYFAISEYPTYMYPGNDADTVEQISTGSMLLGLLLLWGNTNYLWEADLKNRGYVMTKSLRARSIDDALAIIEREKSLTKDR